MSQKMGTVTLRVKEEGGSTRSAWPLTRGVPLPAGKVIEVGALWLENAEGEAVATQLRVLARWRDRSLKWVLVDFQVDLEAGEEKEYFLRWNGDKKEAEAAEYIDVLEKEGRIEVCTGPLRFGVSKRHFSLLEFAEVGARDSAGLFAASADVVARGKGDAWAKISESEQDGHTARQLYGMGGTCRAALAADEYNVEIETAGPLCTVLRCSGAYEAEVPMHHYAGYRPLRWITRIYAYAGKSFVRVLHTIIFTGNAREVEVEELGLHVPLVTGGKHHYRLETMPPQQSLAQGEHVLLAQERDDYFQGRHYAGTESQQLVEGAHCSGWAALDNGRVGIGVALRHMAEEYPKALGLSAAGVDVFFWRDAASKKLSYRRYAEEVAWHEGEGVYSDGLGSAKSSEFFLCFYSAGEAVEKVLKGLLQNPALILDPASTQRTGALGNGACDPKHFADSEKMLAAFVEWMARNIERERWCGYLDWGDVLATWEEGADAWRFKGRWGWCNSEWDPRHAVWLHYLRTGETRWFRLGEAMTRHSLDVDTCHYNPLRPYWVGGSYRHSMDHFGDEPCASHTFIDNWIDYYYLTGDGRAREVIEEAGAFFLRYRWSEDPRYSFSLRSIANVLRGLLYVYEVTGDTRYEQRAEQVYAVLARAQNADGSWHKRFQVSTLDRLPNQAPYGMATEGSTLAVEMGTAAAFSDDEFRALGWPFSTLRKELPYAEQKGYQTHYLLIGLELMHRMTNREDVATLYVRAVDWFCGGAGAFDADFALTQHYYGVLCGSLAYAYRLTGERRYLEVGQKIVRHLRQIQDWSGHPSRHGAVAMTPTALSLVFFGVPPLLAALGEAGMEE